MQGVFPKAYFSHDWPDELIARLTELWAKGLSSSLIGAEIGKTRNAVMGKVNRLGLPMRRTLTAVNSERKTRAPKPKKPKVQRPPSPEALARRAIIAARQGPIALDDMAIPIDQRKTLQELKKTSCRWPVGDPDREGFFFCGGVAEMDRPYCPAHARRAFQCR